MTSEPAELLAPSYPWHVEFGPRMPARAHGGGCCVRLHRRLANGRRSWLVVAPGAPGSSMARRAPDDDAALLGVLHYRLDRNQYLQQLYAFQPSPPFKVIALSKTFCWLDDSTQGVQLYRRGRKYACPHVQMSMSVTPKLDDASAAVVASGMNDCTSRVVVIKDINTLFEQVELRLP